MRSGGWGGANDQQTPVFGSAADERGAILRLSNEALAVGCSPAQVVQYRRDAALGEAGHEICYAARANAFVIRPDGRVAKCTVALDDERNTVGRLRKNGDVVIDPSRHLPWLQGLVSGDAVALNCPARAYLGRINDRSIQDR